MDQKYKCTIYIDNNSGVSYKDVLVNDFYKQKGSFSYCPENGKKVQ